MTLDFCNRCASELEQNPLVQNGINYSSSYSDVFSPLDSRGVVTCSKGFDERYEKPYTAGGKYATLTDFKNLFSIGQTYGKAKLLGWKPRWDSDFCEAIGGYPKGSILRAVDGTKMISRIGDNMEELPADALTTDEWKRMGCVPQFNIPKGEGGQWARDGRAYEVSIPELPVTPGGGTWKQLVGTMNCEESHLAICSYLYNAVNRTAQKDYSVFLDLCVQGDMVLKVSQYPDIYTNEDHSDEYIELLHAQTINLQGDEDWPESYKPTLHLRNPHKVVPFKKGVTYYFYLEYDRGCASDGAGLSPLLYRRLVMYRAYRRLAWPYV